MSRPYAERGKKVSTTSTHASVECYRPPQVPVTQAKNSVACVGEAGLNALMATARRLWPAKTASALADAAGASERRAEQWLAGSAKPGAAAVIRLLHSTWGEDFHLALMTAAGAPPTWFAARERRLRRDALRRELELLERGEA